MTAPGLVIAAPASGSGKTVVTLGLIAALRESGLEIRAAKTGPDYIDTAFLAAASAAPAVNLDPWAMRPETLAALVSGVLHADMLVVEGVMGLFDGAAGGRGSTASLARMLELPVVLVVDAGGQAQSVAALAQGFRTFDASVEVAGVILNRVAGARHEALLREGLDLSGTPVFGALPRTGDLDLPRRHLGLVQASETDALDAVITSAATLCGEHLDLDGLRTLAGPPSMAANDMSAVAAWPPPGQRIAVARDEAFAFAYAHVLDGWRRAGAEVVPFSPLADEPPCGDADAVYLPGGYPELHAGRLAGNATFLDGLRSAAERRAAVFGECGGYMALGKILIDGGGARHRMAGLLDLETSFAERSLHLGYRTACLESPAAGLPAGSELRGHEFHYATVLRESGEPLFDLADADGNRLGPSGLRRGTVAGSFLHIIDRLT